MNATVFAETSSPVDDDSQYGYVPTLYVCIIFVSLFGISTLLHLGQAVYFKMWWLLPTAVLAGIGETVGWTGRLWSSYSPTLDDPFLMQITTTIISPTPLLAANFIILGRVISLLGPEYSRLSPKWYTIIFCGFDVIALIVQAYGGAAASSADTPQGSANGGRIMLGGIAFQLAAITVYVAFASDFLFRYMKDRPYSRPEAKHEPLDSRQSSIELQSGLHVQRASHRATLTQRRKLMIVALVFSAIVLYIRSIYRTIELSDGWNGRIIETQVYFNVLDGAMIVLAMYTLNVLHPGLLLR